MTFDPERSAVASVRALKPYLPGKPIAELERQYGVSNIVKLASNENPLGTGRLAREAISTAIADLSLYPDPNGFDLKNTLAEKHGVDPAQITLGNGSNDVLVLLAEAYLSGAGNAVYSQYAFAVYPIATQAVGAEHRVAPALPMDGPQPLGHDLEAMRSLIDEDTGIVFIANPNNPTGTWVEPDQLERFVARVPDHCLVVVDEAYIEYSQSDVENAAVWLDRYPNLVVTRTFSKAYGLAGLRVGYALSQAGVADYLNRVRQPFNVNTVALAAAQAAVGDIDFLDQSRSLNDAGLEQLQAGLDRLELTWIPSRGNFLLVDMGRDAAPIYDQLLRNGVIVRPVGNYGLPNHLRITVGTKEQNDLLLAALGKVL